MNVESRNVHSTLRHWTCHQIVRCADEERLVRLHGYAKHCVGDLCPLGMTSFDVSATSPCNGFIRNSRAFACVLWQCKETVFERLSTHSSACVCTLILYLKLQNAGITSRKSKSNMSILASSCELTQIQLHEIPKVSIHVNGPQCPPNKSTNAG